MAGRRLATQIAVVGAGPAGARAAELLAGAGGDVVLVDPRAPWEKPCGGGLTESLFEEMPELLDLEPRTRPVRRLRIETSPERGFAFTLERPIRIVSRRTLARWQLERALDAGAMHLKERGRSLRRVAGRWSLRTDRREVVADLLVGADGAASRVRRFVAPKLSVELEPTRLFLVPGAGPTPEDMFVRLMHGVAGYVWDFPRPDHRSVGIVVGPGEWRRPRMDTEIEAFRRSTEACLRADDGTERTGAVIGTAQLGHGDYASIGGPDFALLGDAAGLADPATGEGIRNAIRSADLLATTWRAQGTFADYPARVRQAFEREFQVSRVVRRFLFDGEGGMRMVRAGQRSDAALAVVAAVLGALNEHDWSLAGMLDRWWRARSAIRQEPASAQREGRSPASCGPGCGCAHVAGTGHGSGVEASQGAECAA